LIDSERLFQEFRVFRTALICAVYVAQTISSNAADTDLRSGRASVLPLIRQEAGKTGMPWEIADAVASVESGYDPTRIGSVGEVGLMQVRPSTAALMGFVGSALDLMRPEVNVHYGVQYLAGAWQLAGGDLCRTLMKYRAGHGEVAMTARSNLYCARAKAHLAAIQSPLADSPGPSPIVAEVLPKSREGRRSVKLSSFNGTRLRGSAFWFAHDAHVAVLRARIERRWRVAALR
jgi:soluble lytic murein transglycosylase-like protein